MKANYEEPSMEIIEISDGNVTTLIEQSGKRANPVEVDFTSDDDWFL